MTTLHFGSGQSLVPSTPPSRREIEKRTFFSANFVQFRKESFQKFLTKASSDSASKFKFLPFVEADKQRAKILSRPLRLGVPADNKFLLLMELDPCSASFPGLISGATACTNQTLKSEFASTVQKLWNIFCKRDRIPDHARRLFQQFFQLRLSFFDW